MSERKITGEKKGGFIFSVVTHAPYFPSAGPTPDVSSRDNYTSQGL